MISDPPVSNRSRARLPDLVNRGAPKTVVSAWRITVDNTAARYGKTAPRKITRARERQRNSLHNGRVRQYGQRRTSRPGWQAKVCLPTPDSSSPSYALLLLLLLFLVFSPTTPNQSRRRAVATAGYGQAAAHFTHQRHRLSSLPTHLHVHPHTLPHSTHQDILV